MSNEDEVENYLSYFIGRWNFNLKASNGNVRSGERIFKKYNKTNLKFKENFENKNIEGEGFFGYNITKNSFFEFSIFNVASFSEVLVGKFSNKGNKIEFNLVDPFSGELLTLIKTELIQIDNHNFMWENYTKTDDGWNLEFRSSFKRIEN